MAKAATAATPMPLSPVRRAKLLERVAAFYHQRFLDRTEGQQYLSQVRGIRNVGLFRDYRVGYADGSLLQALPQDAESTSLFRQLGVLNGRNREVLAGCIVFPLFDAAGSVVSLYGRRIEDSVPNHLYLGGEAIGVWNAQAARRSSRLLLTGSILDALTLVDRGMSDVLPRIGQGGLNDDQLALLSQCGVKAVTVCLRGGESTAQIEDQLAPLQIAVDWVALSHGEDVNTFLCRQEIGAFQNLMPKIEARQARESAGCRHTAQGLILRVSARRYEVKPSSGRARSSKPPSRRARITRRASSCTRWTCTAPARATPTRRPAGSCSAWKRRRSKPISIVWWPRSKPGRRKRPRARPCGSR